MTFVPPFWKFLLKIRSAYKYLKAEDYDISLFVLSLDTHQKSDTQKENYQALSRALRVHLSMDETIHSYTGPKLHVKIVTDMNPDNGFNLLVALVFVMIPQNGNLWTKYQDLVIPFCFIERKTVPQLYIRALQEISETLLLNYKTGQTNILTGKYIMYLSKLKHIQSYKNKFELEYKKLNASHIVTNYALHFNSQLKKYLRP